MENDRLLHSRPARLSRAPIRGRMGITGFRQKVRQVRIPGSSDPGPRADPKKCRGNANCRKCPILAQNAQDGNWAKLGRDSPASAAGARSPRKANPKICESPVPYIGTFLNGQENGQEILSHTPRVDRYPAQLCGTGLITRGWNATEIKVKQ